MVALTYYLTNLLFYDVSLLYSYINLSPSIILCLSSRDKNLSLGISLSSPLFFFYLQTVSELFFGEGLKTFVILSSNLLPIKSPVSSALFWIAFFKGVCSASVADCLAWSRRFWLYFPVKFLHKFLPKILLRFLVKDRNPLTFTISYL